MVCLLSDIFILTYDGPFLGRDSHIPDHLYIMVMYISFYGFLIFFNFFSKSIYVSVRF
jgi:hypothetical protein